MPIRAVVFDRDGVLTRFDFAEVEALFADAPHVTLEALFVRWHEYYLSRALPRTVDEERRYLQRFWDLVCVEQALDDATRRRLHDFDYVRTIRPFPEAEPVLREVRARGLRVGVLSNFPLVSLPASLAATGLGEHVDVARAASIEGTPKPHPAAYRDMLAQLGVTPAECVFLDDEIECVDGATAVGMEAYLVERDAGGERSARSLGDLRELLDLLDE